MSALSVLTLLTDTEPLAGLPYEGDEAAQLYQFAHALSHSPLWPEDAVLVVQEDPLTLAVLGFFDEASFARLENLQYQLEHVLPTLRYLNYEEVTAACQRLADVLRATLSAEELAAASFVGLPRGGLIVLGILAYLLDVRRTQLDALAETESTVIIVDDCSLSGLRFRQFKARYARYNLVFATLFSPSELRATIEAEEANVRCVSAYDLTDRAREKYGDGYAAWRTRWRERNAEAYFIGLPEQVAFPWNEPDASFWNAVTEREESGWHFTTPTACLKHRHHPQRVPVHHHPHFSGPIRPAASVLYGRLDERIVIGDVQKGEGFALDGVAADMWEALMQHGTLEEAVLALQTMYGVDRNRLQNDLHALADELEHRGLLGRG